jgi:hypothetical protein
MWAREADSPCSVVMVEYTVDWPSIARSQSDCWTVVVWSSTEDSLPAGSTWTPHPGYSRISTKPPGADPGGWSVPECRAQRLPRPSRVRTTPSPIMPTPSTKCSQLSAVLTGTKFAALSWWITRPYSHNSR